jgi:hypothetical protein
MQLTKTTFWEYDIDKLNPATDYYTIIPRIAMRGTYTEWLELRKYYGDKKIIEVLKQERYLDKKTLHFISSLFDIPLTEFRCYTERQLHPPPGNY